MSDEEKPRCSGAWTESRYQNFIISALRKATGRWGPKNYCIKVASDKAKKLIESDLVKYKEYLTLKGKFKTGPFICEHCNTIQMASIPTPKDSSSKKKSISNKLSDHIEPIVDPNVGFTTFDEWIKRGFPEKESFQALCHACHQVKCKVETKIRTDRQREEKGVLKGDDYKLAVRIEGKIVGHIKGVDGGFAYFPKGKGMPRGYIFKTIKECENNFIEEKAKIKLKNK